MKCHVILVSFAIKAFAKTLFSTLDHQIILADAREYYRWIYVFLQNFLRKL